MGDLDGLDPLDWSELRALAHRMVDDTFDHMAHVRERPVWQPMPNVLREELKSGLPYQGCAPHEVYDRFQRLVQPYGTGNTHPGFMGWVHGGGNPVGMLGEFLAAGLNANLGGRDHAPILVERQVIAWSAEMLGMPEQSAGVLVTGTSIANLIGVLTARTAALGGDVRRTGLQGARLVAYASAAAHGCVPRAMDMAGLGSNALRSVPVDQAGRMRLDALREAVAQDIAEGGIPFLVIGTAGTVDIGAIDDLSGIAEFCEREKLWFHIDGAFGALAVLSPRLKPLLKGIEKADSIAFDFHKWGQAPYDAGCIVVRDANLLTQSFGQNLAYLRREPRGLAAGQPWPCDFGPDLSRGFRALKVWMALQTYGADRFGQVIETCCDVAQHLARRVDAEPDLELLAPVGLNIVCFRVAEGGDDLDQFNIDVVADVQESGEAAPSTTRIDGKLAIRAAIVNHRTRPQDVDRMVDAVLRFARARRNQKTM